MTAILTDDMQRLVREQKLAYVATVSPDGTPNLSPKGTTTVWDDRHLVFADIRSPQTVANLERNPAVEVNVVDPIARRGYRFKGSGRVVREGDLFEAAMELFQRDLRDARGRVRSVVLIRVEQARRLTSPAYDLGLSEEQIVRTWTEYWERIRRERAARSGGESRPSEAP